MRVKCIKDYYDLELKKTVIKGEEFEVSDARGKALTTTANKSGSKLCEVIEATTPTPEKVAKQPKRKKAVADE